MDLRQANCESENWNATETLVTGSCEYVNELSAVMKGVILTNWVTVLRGVGKY
jgi:hypothetical protein